MPIAENKLRTKPLVHLMDSSVSQLVQQLAIHKI